MIPKNAHCQSQSLHLPLELLRPIIHCIDDQGSLYALTLSASLLRQEAEKRLYASPMTLSTSSKRIFESAEVIKMQASFLSTITTNPRLASLVRSYRIPSHVGHFARRSRIWELVKQGLCEMIGLRELRLELFGGLPIAGSLLLGLPDNWSTNDSIESKSDVDAASEKSNRRRPSFQLETLNWGSGNDEVAIASFLRSQVLLRNLYLEIHPKYIPLFLASSISNASPQEVLVPLLDFVGGNRWTIEAFFPGRNIARLAWASNAFDDLPESESATRLSVLRSSQDGMQKLRSLSFGAYLYPVSPHLCLISGLLRDLELLELVSSSMHDDLSILASLPNLQELVFCVEVETATRESLCSASDYKDMVHGLFLKCGRLVRMDVGILFTHSTRKELRYARWTATRDKRATIIGTETDRDGCDEVRPVELDLNGPVMLSLHQVRSGRFLYHH